MTEKFPRSDEQLADAVRRGDKEMYRHIIDRYEGKLFRYVNYLLRNRDDALDVVQDTFIKAYVNLNGFNTGKKFASWIYRIAHNEAMNKLNKHRKVIKLPEEYELPTGEDMEEEYGKNETRKMALDCLDEMPVIYSEPLSLYFLEDKSYEEISDILHLPSGTVATRINRAKSLMKKICQKKK